MFALVELRARDDKFRMIALGNTVILFRLITR